jgi:hypothetical protein
MPLVPPIAIGCYAQNENAVQATKDLLAPLDLAHLKVGGKIGRRIGVSVTNNVLRLDIDKDLLPAFQKKHGQDGSHKGFGKLMDAVVRLAYYTRDENVVSLKNHLVDEIVKAQEPDGYVGVVAPENRISKVWGLHEVNYIVYALVSDYRMFGEERSLAAARKAADHVVNNWSRIPRGLGAADKNRGVRQCDWPGSDDAHASRCHW